MAYVLPTSGPYRPIAAIAFGKAPDDFTLSCVKDLTANATKTVAEPIRVGCHNNPVALDGPEELGQIEIKFKLNDEIGVDAAIKKLLVGIAATRNQPISVMPEGEGAGKPQQVWPSVSLEAKNYSANSDETSTDVASGEVTLKGTFDTEPTWSVQA